MKTAFFIARKYFLYKRKQKTKKPFFQRLKEIRFINLLTIISMVGIGVVSMALVIVLSVFNGLEEVTRDLHKAINPDLRISPKEGKSFILSDSLESIIKSDSRIAALTHVVEDNALLRYNGSQMVVKLKGVDKNFNLQYPLQENIIEGKSEIYKDSVPRAILGAGIKYQMSILLEDKMTALQIWYPKKETKINIDPTKSFNIKGILPSGVFAIEQQYDNSNVIVPIEFMRSLIDYPNKSTSLELKVKNEKDLADVQNSLTDLLGKTFEIKNSDQQQEAMIKAIQIERFFVFMTCVFILTIASFNIFFCLIMLSIEKKKDVAILKSFGANKSTIRKIFYIEGALISFSGAFSGLILGFIICWVQQQYGVIGIGLDSAVLSSYPVKIVWTDFALAALAVVFITLLASFFPAKKASEVIISTHI